MGNLLSVRRRCPGNRGATDFASAGLPSRSPERGEGWQECQNYTDNVLKT